MGILLILKFWHRLPLGNKFIRKFAASQAISCFYSDCYSLLLITVAPFIRWAMLTTISHKGYYNLSRINYATGLDYFFDSNTIGFHPSKSVGRFTATGNI